MAGNGYALVAAGGIFICIGNGDFMDLISTLPKRYLDVREVAQYLGLSVKTIYRLVDDRKIPFVKPGGIDSLRFDIKAIDKWIEKQTVPAKSQLSI